MNKNYYKNHVENILNKYNLFIYEITYVDKIKNIYIASKQDKKVIKVMSDTTWQGLSEQIAYNLTMFSSL